MIKTRKFLKDLGISMPKGYRRMRFGDNFLGGYAFIYNDGSIKHNNYEYYLPYSLSHLEYEDGIYLKKKNNA